MGFANVSVEHSRKDGPGREKCAIKILKFLQWLEVLFYAFFAHFTGYFGHM